VQGRVLAPQVARRCANPPRTIPLLLAHPAPPIPPLPRSLAARPRRQKQPKRRSTLSISAARFNPSPITGSITSSCVLRLRVASWALLLPHAPFRWLPLGSRWLLSPAQSSPPSPFLPLVPHYFQGTRHSASLASFSCPPCPLEHSCNFAHSYRKSVTREELIASDGLELHLPCVILTAQICRTPVPSSGHAGNHTVCKSSAFKVHAIASCQHHSILRGFGWASFLAGSAPAFAL